MPALPDNELVLRLQSDDAEAFDALYRRYNHSLYLNIFKLTKDAEAARDILQEVFIVLWEKRQSIDNIRPVSSWLFSISYYKSLKHLKKTLKEQLLFSDAGLYPLAVEEPEEASTENKLEAAKNAIRRLSPQKQKVLIRCKLAGKTYKEVAEELSISKHTVKEYLALALSSLRTTLKLYILLFLLQ